RPRQRLAVRPLRDRDRRARLDLAARDDGAGDAARPLRPRPLRRDGLLRAPERRARLLRGRPQLRRAGAALAGGDAAAGERLAPARRAVRILLVSQMYPGPDAPDLGTFVRQVELELRARGHEIELAVLDTRAGGRLRYLELARRTA